MFSDSSYPSALLPIFPVIKPPVLKQFQCFSTFCQTSNFLAPTTSNASNPLALCPIFPVSKVLKHYQPPNEPLSLMLTFWCAATKIQVQTNNKAITVTYPNYTLGFRVCYPLMDRLQTHVKRERCDHTNKGHASCQSKKPRVIIISHYSNPTRELTVYIVKYWRYTKGDLVWCDTRLRIKQTHTHTHGKQYKVRNILNVIRPKL